MCYIYMSLCPQLIYLLPLPVVFGNGNVSFLSIGVAAGPLWAAKSTYLSTSAIEYSQIIGKEKGPVLTHFFGVFTAIFQTGSILGSVLMSVILKSGGKFIHLICMI